MGTHPSKIQDKREHMQTQPKGNPKANNQPKSGKEEVSTHKLSVVLRVVQARCSQRVG